MKTKYVLFNKNKPVATSNSEETKRLESRVEIIDKVLKEMGYKEGYTKYNDYIIEMMKDFKGKYMPFLERVDKLAKEYGV